MKPVILSSALLLLSLRAFAQGTPPAANAEGFKPIVVTNQVGETPEVVTIEAKGQPLLKVSLADSPKNTRIVIIPSALNKQTTANLQKGVTTIKGTFSALLSQDGQGLWSLIVFDGILTIRPITPAQTSTSQGNHNRKYLVERSQGSSPRCSTQVGFVPSREPSRHFLSKNTR